jgi:YHS domain-containing protein
VRLAYVLFLLAAACPGAKGDAGFTTPPPDGTKIRDVVSGEECEKTPLTQAAVFESKTYYFCCADCPRRFREAPARFVRSP